MVCHTLSQHDALPIWFLPGLDLTVDYWDIDIKNVITQFSYATLIRLCVDAPTIDNAYCARVTRDPVTGYATRVESNQLNAARLYARGVDIGMGYRRPVGEGTLSLSFKGTYLLDKVTETTRSEERRVGKEGVSTGRSRW